jgi:hypothetical protein
MFKDAAGLRGDTPLSKSIPIKGNDLLHHRLQILSARPAICLRRALV